MRKGNCNGFAQTNEKKKKDSLKYREKKKMTVKYDPDTPKEGRNFHPDRESFRLHRRHPDSYQASESDRPDSIAPDGSHA